MNTPPMKLESILESILFGSGYPMTLNQLSDLTLRSLEEVTEALKRLRNDLDGRGIVLLELDESVTLGTHPEASGYLRKLREDELSRTLGKAGLETLALVLYRGPVSKSEIDFVRGVNAGSILRNLQIRGLIEKSTDPASTRKNLYRGTLDAYAFLGITSKEELPHYQEVISGIERFEEQQGVTPDSESGQGELAENS